MVWPFLIVEALDDRNSWHRRIAARDKFYNANACDLDEGFMYRLRRQVPVADFFSATILSFTVRMFSRMLLSTQFIECIFAQFRQWLIVGKGGSGASIARKHISHKFMLRHQSALVDKMRFGVERSVRRTGRSRPVWVATQKQERCGNGAASFRGSFIRRVRAEARVAGETFDQSDAMSRAHSEWRKRSAADKKKDRATAKRNSLVRPKPVDGLRHLIRCFEHDDPEAKQLSPWGFGDATSPLCQKLVKEKFFDNSARIQEYAETFLRRVEVAHPDPEFRDGLVWTKPCLEKHCECIKDLRRRLSHYEDVLEDLVYSMRLYLAPVGRSKQARVENATPVIRMTSACGEELFVQMCSWRCGPFELEAFLYEAPRPALPPFLLKLGFRTLGGRQVAALQTESELASKMASVSTEKQWQYYHCVAHTTPLMQKRVTDFKEIRVEELLKEQRMDMLRKKALRSLKRGLTHWKKVSDETVKRTVRPVAKPAAPPSLVPLPADRVVAPRPKLAAAPPKKAAAAVAKATAKATASGRPATPGTKKKSPIPESIGDLPTDVLSGDGHTSDDSATEIMEVLLEMSSDEEVSASMKKNWEELHEIAAKRDTADLVGGPSGAPGADPASLPNGGGPSGGGDREKGPAPPVDDPRRDDHGYIHMPHKASAVGRVTCSLFKCSIVASATQRRNAGQFSRRPERNAAAVIDH